jgi:phosphatidylserine/phosphatidylglycerophosphate/cardiolipin synthase-like enzyme
MAELLPSTATITSEIEKLINESNGEKLVLITPYLRIARQFKSCIQDQVNFKTNISVVVRAGESHDPADINFLQELKINLYTHENLHAKCYLNHKTAIITSMNLYEYSQLNNTELGVIITKEGDPKLYEQINETVKKIIRNSKEFEFEIKKVDKTKVLPQTSEKKAKDIPPRKESITQDFGYCIRCGEKTIFNPIKPLCDKCYPIWAKNSNPAYPEKFCHVCGKSSKQSYEKPVCYSCYKKLYK